MTTYSDTTAAACRRNQGAASGDRSGHRQISHHGHHVRRAPIVRNDDHRRV